MYSILSHYVQHGNKLPGNCYEDRRRAARLDYLCETKHYRLAFVASDESPELRVYTDPSFAPSSGRSHGAAATVVLF